MVYFEKVAKESEGRLGIGHSETLEWIDVLLGLLQLMGKDEAAKNYHRYILRRQQESFGLDHPCYSFGWVYADR